MVQSVKSYVNDVSPESVGLPGVSAVALALQPTSPHAQQGTRAPYTNGRAHPAVVESERHTWGIEMARAVNAPEGINGQVSGLARGGRLRRPAGRSANASGSATGEARCVSAWPQLRY